MKAAVLYGARDLRLEEVDMPKPAADEVLIKIKANGVCGSDIHFYEDGRLSIFVVKKPYITGHEASGVVHEVGSEVKGFKRGDRVVPEPGIACRKCVLCKGGHYNLCPNMVFMSAPSVDGTLVEYITVPADYVHKTPPEKSFEEMALVEPLAVAVHLCGRGEVKPGSTVAVFGAGPIGLMTVMTCKARGAARIFAVDLVQQKLKLAESLGAAETINATSKDPVAEILQATDRRGVDVAFETSGSTEAARATVEVTGRGGIAAHVGWPSKRLLPYPVEQIIAREIDVRGSITYVNEFPTAIGLISQGKVDVGKLITHRFKFDETPQAFEFISKNRDKVVKAVIEN